MRYYVVEVWGDVQPSLHGPYNTNERRDKKARALRAADACNRNGIYWLDQTICGALQVGSYSNAFFEVQP